MKTAIELKNSPAGKNRIEAPLPSRLTTKPVKAAGGESGQVRDQIEPAAKALDLLRHFRLGKMLERLLGGVVYLPVRDLGGNHGQEYQEHHEDEVARAKYQFVKVVKLLAGRPSNFRASVILSASARRYR